MQDVFFFFFPTRGLGADKHNSQSTSWFYDNSQVLGHCHTNSAVSPLFQPAVPPKGKHLLLKSQLTIFPAVCLKLFVFAFLYIICWPHPDRASRVSGAGFKRFRPLGLGLSLCTMSPGLSVFQVCLHLVLLVYERVHISDCKCRSTQMEPQVPAVLSLKLY